MRCSKDEGLLMLNKWLHDSTDLILILWGCGYKTSRFAWGGKFQLEAGQNFVCRLIGSIHIPSESAKFDYGDVASDAFAQKSAVTGIRNSLQVQMTTIERDRSANAVLASSLLSITEVVQ